MTKAGLILRKLSRAPWKGWLLLSRFFNLLEFKVQGVSIGKGAVLEGKIYVRNADGGTIRIGDSFHMIGGYCRNRISRNMASCLSTQGEGKIVIGNGVGISSSTIWARNRILIGDRVNVGADTIIMDHDAHSLDPSLRVDYSLDEPSIRSAPVEIGDDVLVGARCIILKGAKIGRGSILGAGSVLASSVPEGEIWAGNPARKIRSIE